MSPYEVIRSGWVTWVVARKGQAENGLPVGQGGRGSWQSFAGEGSGSRVIELPGDVLHECPVRKGEVVIASQ